MNTTKDANYKDIPARRICLIERMKNIYGDKYPACILVVQFYESCKAYPDYEAWDECLKYVVDAHERTPFKINCS